jgi:hypothetical protein
MVVDDHKPLNRLAVCSDIFEPDISVPITKSGANAQAERSKSYGKLCLNEQFKSSKPECCF